MELVNTINGYLWSYILIGLLLISGIFIQSEPALLKSFVRGYGKVGHRKAVCFKRRRKREGHQVSAFQAFCISVSSHVGTGNLAGLLLQLYWEDPELYFGCGLLP